MELPCPRKSCVCIAASCCDLGQVTQVRSPRNCLSSKRRSLISKPRPWRMTSLRLGPPCTNLQLFCNGAIDPYRERRLGSPCLGCRAKFSCTRIYDYLTKTLIEYSWQERSNTEERLKARRHRLWLSSLRPAYFSSRLQTRVGSSRQRFASRLVPVTLGRISNRVKKFKKKVGIKTSNATPFIHQSILLIILSGSNDLTNS